MSPSQLEALAGAINSIFEWFAQCSARPITNTMQIAIDRLTDDAGRVSDRMTFALGVSGDVESCDEIQ